MNKKRIAFLSLGFMLKTMLVLGICLSLFFAVFIHFIVICDLEPIALLSELTGDHKFGIAAMLISYIGVIAFTSIEILLCRRYRFTGSIFAFLFSVASIFYCVMLIFGNAVRIKKVPDITNYISIFLMILGILIALFVLLHQISLTRRNFNTFCARAAKLIHVLRPVYLILSFFILAVIYCRSGQNNCTLEDVEILNAFSDGEKTYFTANDSPTGYSCGLFSYNGRKFKWVVLPRENYCFTYDDEHIYYVWKSFGSNFIIRRDKNTEKYASLYTGTNDIDFLYVGDKIIYSESKGDTEGYEDMISTYSVYCTEKDGSGRKQLLETELSTDVPSKDIADFMVSGGYVYYLYPGVGDLYRINIESGSNEFVTAETQLSYKEDYFGVYMYGNKIYYSSTAYNNSGEFLGTYNLYGLDLTTGEKELAAEDVTSFKIIGDLFIYNGKIHNEKWEVIAENINTSSICGNDDSFIYYTGCDSAQSKKYLYKYNIESGKVTNISKAFNSAYENARRRKIGIGKDNVYVWNDGVFQIGHYSDGNHLDYHFDNFPLIKSVLEKVITYKAKDDKLFVITEEGYAVIDKTNTAKVLITVSEDEFTNGYYTNDEGVKIPYTRFIDDPQIVYLESFDDFEAEEQKQFEKMEK
ncbi:MAG: DUF5050 domain-containing protein [Clostridiales bacterium]|nr:DUF5050 domain-containing protein [Clostridiales bacterium]